MAKITAWQASDGSLHATEELQVEHDSRLELQTLVTTMAKTLEGNAPDKDDWNCSAYAEPEDMELAVNILLQSHAPEVRKALDLIDSITQASNKVKKIAKKKVGGA